MKFYQKMCCTYLLCRRRGLGARFRQPIFSGYQLLLQGMHPLAPCGGRRVQALGRLPGNTEIAIPGGLCPSPW